MGLFKKTAGNPNGMATTTTNGDTADQESRERNAATTQQTLSEVATRVEGPDGQAYWTPRR